MINVRRVGRAKGQLRSQLHRHENKTEKLKAEVRDLEEEKSALQHQIDQRTEQLNVQKQQSSSLLRERGDVIQKLEADLDRSAGDLHVTVEQARHVQEKLGAHSATIQQLQGELHQLRHEGEQKDATDEELEDQGFDAEVALSNDGRAF